MHPIAVARRCALSFSLALAGLHTVALAQPAPAPASLAPEVFFKDAVLHEARLSPSGKRLAVAAPGAAGLRVGLYVFELGAKIEARRVVQFSNDDVGAFYWVNDDKLVFSATDRRIASGTHYQANGLFSVAADGSGVRQIVQRDSDSEGERKAFGGALTFNHHLLHVPYPHPGEPGNRVLVGKYGLNRSNNTVAYTPYWLNVDTGRALPAVFDEPRGAYRFLFDSHGEARVVLTEQENVRTAFWRAPGEKTWTEITRGDLLGLPFVPVAVDDGGRLFVERLEGPQRYTVLTRFDFQARQPEPRALLSTPGFDPEPQVLLDAGRTVGLRYQTDASATAWFDPAMREFQKQVDARFTDGVNDVDCARCGKPDMVAVVRNHSDRDPGTYWVYRAAAPEAERWSPLGAQQPDVDPRAMAGLELHRIKARDGVEVPVWLTLPKGVAPGKPAPAVVLVHGGPFLRGRTWEWDGMSQFLASRGYLVIEPEFRGSQGYGDKHFRSGYRQWGQAMQDDVADALRWAQSQKLATDRACIAGGSYGGYSTLMGLAKDGDLYRCGVAWSGATDLMLWIKGDRWVDDDLGSSYRNYLAPQEIGDPVKDADMLKANSPVYLAERIRAPLMLVYGERDRRVPIEHGERMREALVKAGRPPEWVTYRGEAHGFGNLDNSVDFANRLQGFLDKHLKGAPAAAQGGQ
ncbi:prolyl oligopeptidase family serine peptidase [Mitsuaria sp. GD03876]|uniref:alpha/beta hydrolase family protein n=1 Tax=Mitsuaria sp. GD03876 TaxID=2975399 RepID=UPI002447DD80|nr:prolyl oligopeptidase family serine peptidase [Mitsuaria sp. GD03876]MDH0867651.1 prolyl oligopeptidase family serine peptidase [Mitsuaria sp. GD03876]